MLHILWLKMVKVMEMMAFFKLEIYSKIFISSPPHMLININQRLKYDSLNGFIHFVLFFTSPYFEVGRGVQPV